MSAIQSNPSPTPHCNNPKYTSCSHGFSDPSNESHGVTGTAITVKDQSGIGFQVGTIRAQAGLETEMSLTGLQISAESDFGVGAKVDFFTGAIGSGIRETEDEVRASLSAEVDVARISGEIKTDYGTLEAGVGIGVGAHAALSMQDQDKDGKVEMCAALGGGILTKFNVKLCVEVPDFHPSQAVSTPKPLVVSGVNLRGNR